MRDCDACGKPLQGGIGMGGALLCNGCAEDVRVEIDARRARGESVNALGIARGIFRETHSAGAYLLRDVPAEVMTAAKHRAVDDKCSVRDVIISALRQYLDT